MEEPKRPEELINYYVRLLAATGNITSGLGTLALLWSTVVLLGGFVSVLQIKEFWVLNGLSILMACRVVDNYDKEIKKWVYMGKAKIIAVLHFNAVAALRQIILLQLFLSGLAIFLVPYVSLGVSVWRLVQRDFGEAGDDAANRAKLAAALRIFYALTLFESLFVINWAILEAILIMSVFEVVEVTKKQFGDENWILKVVAMYRSETRRKFKKDGELPGNWNLITYGVGLLQSASGDDDHLWGARLLDKLLDTKDIISVRREILSSRVSIQNLIGMIGRSSTAGDAENRERAARILAHLASDLQITHFPGTLQCICSLLETGRIVYRKKPLCETYPSLEKTSDQQSRSQLEASQRQDVAHMAVAIEDQTDHEQEQVVSTSSAGLVHHMKKFYEYLQGREKAIKEWGRFTYKSRGAKELISQGLVILEGLIQDKVNCTEISRHQWLLYTITSPLRSHDFLSNDVWDDDTMVEMLGKSLTVLSKLLAFPGDGATRLRHELASTTEAVSNLMAILETDSGAAQELHGQALEILTKLAIDDSFKKLDFHKLFKALLCIFFGASNTVAQVEQAERENGPRLMRGKTGEALATLLPLITARDVSVSKQEAMNLVTKVLDQILSSKMGTNVDAAENFVERQRPEEPGSVQPHTQGDEKHSKGRTFLATMVSLVVKVLEKQHPEEEADIIQPHTQGGEKRYEEIKFMAAMLSLAVVICNENVISGEDFAQSTPEDAALAKKLKEILKVNKQCTVECLRVAKLTCQMVIAMIQAKPSCIQYFNEHNFKEALTQALGTMSEVDNCMLFAGNDRDVIKPARSLASLVKETQELLNTAQEQGK